MKLKKTIVMLAAALFTSIAASAFDVTFISVSGKVEFQDGGIWVKAQSGDVIEQGTVISTGYKSSAVIKSQNSTFTIGPMTRITLEKLARQGGKENTQLFIDSGSIQSDVKSGNKFKVRSAVATASVRGTNFTFYSSGRLKVTKGLVALSPAESSRAHVEEKIAESSSDSSEEESSAAPKSTVFTSTNEVGETKGVPVYENQTSSANSSGTGFSTPAQEKTSEVTALASSTGKTSESESETTSTSTSAAIQGTNAAPEGTEVIISISISD
ncbi:FecR family protein [Treponema sp.]|uniref:FecR family protein n=1 Tax=Treponema sp. TaxID=166 RepID=UPI0025E7D405|nr:FecR family protein [Treponema sp.]MCR5217931.1 FecR family protein [Treponema sp.]